MTPRQIKLTKEFTSFAIKVLIALAYISPLFLGVLFSIQTDKQMMAVPLKLITDSPTIQNYIDVFRNVPLLQYLKNTFIVCFVTIVVRLTISCLAAYAFAYYNFPGKSLLFTAVLLTMMIPGQVVTITNYVTMQQMGLINTYLGLVLPGLAAGGSIFLMRQYFLTLPKDYKESATLDGCGEMGYLFRIALPLSIPTLAALAIEMFINIYNAYFWPLLVTNAESMRTIQVGISFLIAGDALNYGRVLAGAVVTLIPSVLIYIFGQDYIIKGMTSGGLKG